MHRPPFPSARVLRPPRRAVNLMIWNEKRVGERSAFSEDPVPRSSESGVERNPSREASELRIVQLRIYRNAKILSRNFLQSLNFEVCGPTNKGRGKRRMLTVKEHSQRNIKVLELSGRFDSHSKLGLEAAILGAQEIGCEHIILNFSNITWIDSVGLGQLFLWYHRMRPNRIRLSIVSPQETVRQLLELANLPEVMPIYQTEDEAIQAAFLPGSLN